MSLMKIGISAHYQFNGEKYDPKDASISINKMAIYDLKIS